MLLKDVIHSSFYICVIFLIIQTVFKSLEREGIINYQLYKLLSGQSQGDKAIVFHDVQKKTILQGIFHDVNFVFVSFPCSSLLSNAKTMTNRLNHIALILKYMNTLLVLCTVIS